MPAKSKVAQSNGSAVKGNASSTSGTATPVSTAEKKDTSDHLATLPVGKPDKKIYDAEQDRIKLEIDALQVKLVSFSSTESFFEADSVGSRLCEIESPLPQSLIQAMTDGPSYERN